jgi:hypothetical protein
VTKATAIRKKIWTPAQWIAFGNRVKRVRAELTAMIMASQHVCRKRELYKLVKVERQLDHWKSSMETVAARDVPGAILTRIFYGDEMPEDVLDD